MQKIKKMKEKKGITLIALIITIIVLLILAAVAINLTIGENGLFNRAQDSIQQYDIAFEKECIQLAILEIKTKLEDITTVNLKEAIERLSGKKVDVTKENDNFKVLYIDSNREYIVFPNGDIVQNTEDNEEGTEVILSGEEFLLEQEPIDNKEVKLTLSLNISKDTVEVEYNEFAINYLENKTEQEKEEIFLSAINYEKLLEQMNNKPEEINSFKFEKFKTIEEFFSELRTQGENIPVDVTNLSSYFEYLKTNKGEISENINTYLTNKKLVLPSLIQEGGKVIVPTDYATSKYFNSYWDHCLNFFRNHKPGTFDEHIFRVFEIEEGVSVKSWEDVSNLLGIKVSSIYEFWQHTLGVEETITDDMVYLVCFQSGVIDMEYIMKYSNDSSYNPMNTYIICFEKEMTVVYPDGTEKKMNRLDNVYYIATEEKEYTFKIKMEDGIVIKSCFVDFLDMLDIYEISEDGVLGIKEEYGYYASIGHWENFPFTEIFIPSEINGIKVKNIKYNFLHSNKKIKKVEIANGIEVIVDYAFYDCSGLTNIIIPNSVTSIGSYAFELCSSLTEITIPNSVTSIGYFAFYRCNSLNEIIVEVNNPKYDSRENCNAIIETDSNKLIQGCKSTIIPNSVTSIGNAAFYNCSGLTNITIPNSVTNIGDSAFYGCSSLTNITIPNSVTSIGYSAFDRCSSLTNITIPNSVTSIGSFAFYGCSSLTNITIPNSVTSVGFRAFDDCTNLKTIIINKPKGSLDTQDWSTRPDWQIIWNG